MGSRSLDDLEPVTLQRIRRWLAICAERWYQVTVVSTYRSFDEQDALYAKGRTEPGQIVTNARGGQSWHNVRRAVDFLVFVNGQPSEDPDVYAQVGKAGEEAGLEWGGRWRNFPDTDHLQCRVAADGAVYAQASDFLESGAVRQA